MRGKLSAAARWRATAAQPPLIRLWSGPQTPSPKGEGSDCRKRCAHPLAPSARGLRPQAVGERTVRLPEIFRVQTVKKMYFCLVACVGATIGRPPAYRSNAFSGTVSCKANGHGRAMLAPTRVFRQSVAAPHFRCPLCRTGVYFSLLTKAVSLCYLVIG